MLEGVVEVLVDVGVVEVDVLVLVLVDVEVEDGCSDSVSDVAGVADVVGTADDVVGATGLGVVPGTVSVREQRQSRSRQRTGPTGSGTRAR